MRKPSISLILIFFSILCGCEKKESTSQSIFNNYLLDEDYAYRFFQGGDVKIDEIWLLGSKDDTKLRNLRSLEKSGLQIVRLSSAEAIQELKFVFSPESRSFDKRVRTTREGRVYYCVIFDKKKQSYAILTISFRSLLKDGTNQFKVTIPYKGAKPVRDVPTFLKFERRFLVK